MAGRGKGLGCALAASLLAIAACGSPSPLHSARSQSAADLGLAMADRLSPLRPPAPDDIPRSAAAALPAATLLAVPYTVQAPFARWSVHEESCEEAALLMIHAYLGGDRRPLIEPAEADRELLAMKRWQVAHWGAERDLPLARLGELALQYYGHSYQVMPANVEGIQRQLALGRPVMLPVMTHGLGNAHYGARSVYHILVLTGFDATGAIANDAGVKEGRGYRYSWAQVFNAMDQVGRQAPALRQGRVMLVLTSSSSR